MRRKARVVAGQRLRRYRRAVAWERLGGQTKLDADEVSRRWRRGHMVILGPWRARRRPYGLRLRGSARAGTPAFATVVVQLRLTAASTGQTFGGWLRPSWPTHVKLAAEIAMVAGGWLVALINPDYRTWEGLGGAVAFTGLGLLGLNLDFGALTEERGHAREQARTALNVRSLRPEQASRVS